MVCFEQTCNMLGDGGMVLPYRISVAAKQFPLKSALLGFHMAETRRCTHSNKGPILSEVAKAAKAHYGPSDMGCTDGLVKTGQTPC